MVFARNSGFARISGFLPETVGLARGMLALVNSTVSPTVFGGAGCPAPCPFSQHPMGVNFSIFDISLQAVVSLCHCTGRGDTAERGARVVGYPGNGGCGGGGADPGGYPWYGSGESTLHCSPLFCHCLAILPCFATVWPFYHCFGHFTTVLAHFPLF